MVGPAMARARAKRSGVLQEPPTADPPAGGQTLATVDRLNPDLVNRAIQQLAIKGKYKDVAKSAIERTKEILHAV
jgi:hypothetical protein